MKTFLFVTFFVSVISQASLFCQPTVVKDIFKGNGASSPSHFTEYSGKIYFVASDSIHGREIWCSDGTEEGTKLLKDINPGKMNIDGWASFRFDLVVFKNKLYFNPTDSLHGMEIYISDGTSQNTKILKDIIPGTEWSYANSFLPTPTKLYFEASTPENGFELWVSDGTENGTSLLKDIKKGRDNSAIYFLDNNEDTLLFVADDGTHGQELWRSDGTANGTYMVKDIIKGSSSSYISNFTKLGKYWYFSSGNFMKSDIWRTDGTPNGTISFSELMPGKTFDVSYSEFVIFKNKIFFKNGSALWTTDGTEEGTSKVMDSYTDNFYLYSLTPSGDKLYFVKSNFIHGSELWVTDGSESGMKFLTKLVGLHNDYYDFRLKDIKGKLYFENKDDNGSELWSSDGTVEGTGIVADINPGPGSAYPHGYFVFNNRFFLVADDGIHGAELMELKNELTSVVRMDHSKIIVYPNPTSSQINFTEKLNKVQLKDVLGNLLFEAKEVEKLDMSMLPEGMYFVTYFHNDILATEKIIVEKR